MSKRTYAAAACISALGIATACTSAGAPDTENAGASEDGVYNVTVQAVTLASLPACSASMAGETAYVSKPAGLYSCIANHWIPIPCTALLNGAVAYASATQSLWACSGGAWIPIVLAPGPAGAKSLITTTAIGDGPECANGGEEIQIGIDTNDNGVLDPAEVQQTAYVCNGGSPVADAGTPKGDAGTPITDAGTPKGDAAPGPPVEGGVATPQWVTGNFFGFELNEYPIASIDWAALTHVTFGPLTVAADQTLDMSFGATNGGAADATALAQAAHAHGVKALLSLGGTSDGANLALAAAPANLTALVKAITSAITTLGFDGVEIDWEDSIDLDEATALVQALRKADPNGLFTYDAPEINANLPSVDARLVTIAQSLDHLNIQTIGGEGIGVGFDSWFPSALSGAAGAMPFAIDNSFKYYAAAGIPSSKLSMAVELAATCYSNSAISGPKQALSSATELEGGEFIYPLSAFFASKSTYSSTAATSRLRDANAQVPYLSLPAAVNDNGCGGPTQYITYEDELSIAAKGTYSKQNNFGGVVIVDIQDGWLPAGAADGRAPNALMEAFRTGFLTP